ncbi:MAG: SusC/RagA family TonB-linked outer membrane protein [Marinoscillum sp.]
MKHLYLFILLFGLCLTDALAYQSLVLNNYQDTELVEVLQAIQEEAGINLVYEPSLVSGIHVDPSILKSGKNGKALLKDALKSTDLEFRELGDNTYAIIKSRKEASTNPSPIRISKPDVIVKGIVISSEDDEPIPGVTILEKGTSNGTVTDIDGNFSLEVSSAEAMLVVSSIGFKTREVAVDNATTINIELVPDVQELGEVVVTALGLESDRRELGYSVQNIDTEDLLKSRETNISSALSAKVPGVQVITSSGSPGASASVKIRGNRSMSQDNEPLYVIDGVPINNLTAGNGIVGVDVSNRAIDINPNDIEKITVLKGPSATVLYGSRGANGAIMINTKRGKVGKPVVTFSSAYGLNEVNQLPARQNKYAQGRYQAGQSVYRGPETGETQSYGPPISELEFDGDENYPYDQNGRLVPVGTGNGMPARAYDLYDAFWVKGHTYDNNISVNGGTETARYYFSTGHLFQTGVVPGADFERISIKSNIDANLTSKLKVGISATYIHSGGNRALRGSNLSGVTTGVFRTTPTFDIGNGKRGFAASDDPATYSYGNGLQRNFTDNYDNPFWSINKNPYEDHVNRVMGNVNLSYKIFDWLTASYKLGLDQYTDRREQAWDINSSSEPLGKVIQSTIFSNVINSDFLFLISHDFKDIGINATVGQNYYNQNQFSRASEGSIMAVPGFYHISNTSQIASTANQISSMEFYGVFADVRINYRDMLFLTLSGRNDWASSLPSGNNSFFYPSTSIAFDFTDVLGLSGSNVMPYGKLRASYGMVGKEAPPFVTFNYYGSATIDGDGLLGSNNFPAFGVNGFERSSLLGNNELVNELTTTIEFGGDFKFIDGRVGLDLTLYKSYTDEQITSADISATTGFTAIYVNAGRIENKGIEVMLSTSLVRTNNISWDFDIGFYKNENIVVKLPADLESVPLASFTAISSVLREGEPFGVLSGTRYLRNELGQMVIGSDGWPLFSDTQDIIGDPNPDWLGSIRNSLDVYNVQFSFLWDIRKGGDVWNGTKGFMDYLGTSKESGDLREVTGYVFDGVTTEGQPNTVPVDFANPEKGIIKWRRAGSNLGLAEDNIEDASWVRLREVTLGYNFGSGPLKNNKVLQTLELSAYGRNLLLFTQYKGVDPETNLRGPSNAQGWDYFNLPGSRSYGISLKAVLK